MMHATGRAVSIGQSELHCPCHACAFFHSRDEEYELLLPFAKAGAEAGERLFQVVDKAHLEERRRRLAEAGIDVAEAESSRTLGERLSAGKPLRPIRHAGLDPGGSRGRPLQWISDDAAVGEHGMGAG